MVIQAVTTSRFEVFVSSRSSQVEVLAREALPKVTFTEFVKKLEAKDAERRRTETYAHMGVSGAKRSESEFNDSVELLSPADTVKRRTLSKQRTERQLGTDAFAALPVPSNASSSLCTASTFSGPTWLKILPAKKDPWSSKTLQLLFAEWGSGMYIRFQAWVGDHRSEEMAKTARGLTTTPMGTTKKVGIRVVLKATRTPPRVFTNLATGVRGVYRDTHETEGEGLDTTERAPQVLLRCTTPGEQEARLNDIDDHVVANMLTLRCIPQKLGLDAHILQCTEPFVDALHDLHDLNYAPLSYIHSSDTKTNTQRRVTILSHIGSQREEQAMSDPQFCASH